MSSPGRAFPARAIRICPGKRGAFPGKSNQDLSRQASMQATDQSQELSAGVGSWQELPRSRGVCLNWELRGNSRGLSLDGG